MGNEMKDSGLPKAASEYIDLVAKKVRYRRKVRGEVREELAGHFEDALHGITDEQERIEKAIALIKEFGEPKMLATLIRRGKKRCRPVWVKALMRTCQAVGTAILVLIAYIAFLFTGKPNITVDYVARLNELVRPAVDEHLNAAPLYMKAGEVVVNDPNGLVLPWCASPNVEQMQALAAWVAENEPAIKLTIEGNRKPCYWPEYRSKSGMVTEISLPSLAPYRTTAYAICAKAYLNASQGDMQSATALLDESLTLSRRIYTKGTLIEQLISWAASGVTFRTAEAIINDFHPDAQMLATLQDRMEQALSEANFHMSIEGEKMMVGDVVQRTYTGSGHIYLPACAGWISCIDSTSIGAIGKLDATLPVLSAPGKGATLEAASVFMQECERVASMTPYQAQQAGIDMNVAADKMARRHVFFRGFLPSYEKMWYQSCIAGSTSEAFVAVMAIHRWRLDKGDWPLSLDELRQGGYLKAVPMDPWSDGPLIYRRMPDGFILYSVGVNFKDDGGTSIDKDGKAPGERGSNPNQLKPEALDIVFWPLESRAGGR
jgi:hypothetical protein